MARSRFSWAASAIESFNAAKTLFEITAGSSQRIVIVRFDLTFAGTVASAIPILVEIATASVAISGTGVTALTGRPTSSGNPTTARATANRGNSANAANGSEGTIGNVLYTYYVPPTSGVLREWSLDREIEVDPAALLRVRVTAGASVPSAFICEHEE